MVSLLKIDICIYILYFIGSLDFQYSTMVADELSFMPIPMGGEFSHVLDIFGYGLCSRTRSDHMRTSWCLFWTLHYSYLNTCSMICGMGMDEIETKHEQSVVETINDTGHDNPQVTLARCWWMDPYVRTAPWPRLGLSESLLKRPKTMCGWQPGSSCWRTTSFDFLHFFV